MGYWNTSRQIVRALIFMLLLTSCGSNLPIASSPTSTTTPRPTSTPTPTPTPFVSAKTEDWIVTILEVKRGVQLQWNGSPLVPDGNWIVVYGNVQNLTTDEITLYVDDFELTTPSLKGKIQVNRDATGAAGNKAEIKKTVAGYGGLDVAAGQQYPLAIAFDVPDIVERATMRVVNANINVNLDLAQQALLIPTPTITPGPTNTPRPTKTPGPTNTPRPTKTPAPTKTPGPTNTPRPPTAVPPTATAVPPTATTDPLPAAQVAYDQEIGARFSEFYGEFAIFVGRLQGYQIANLLDDEWLQESYNQAKRVERAIDNVIAVQPPLGREIQHDKLAKAVTPCKTSMQIFQDGLNAAYNNNYDLAADEFETATLALDHCSEKLKSYADEIKDQ